MERVGVGGPANHVQEDVHDDAAATRADDATLRDTFACAATSRAAACATSDAAVDEAGEALLRDVDRHHDRKNATHQTLQHIKHVKKAERQRRVRDEACKVQTWQECSGVVGEDVAEWLKQTVNGVARKFGRVPSTSAVDAGGEGHACYERCGTE